MTASLSTYPILELHCFSVGPRAPQIEAISPTITTGRQVLHSNKPPLANESGSYSYRYSFFLCVFVFLYFDGQRLTASVFKATVSMGISIMYSLGVHREL